MIKTGLFMVAIFAIVACKSLLYPYAEGKPKPDQAQALQIVYDVYRPLLSSNLDNVTLHLYWSSDACPYPAPDGRTKSAVIYNKKCYNGLTFLGGVVKVAWRGSFSNSAFAHELLHNALNSTKHGHWLLDPVPPGTELRYPLIDCVACREAEARANEALRAAGL